MSRNRAPSQAAAQVVPDALAAAPDTPDTKSLARQIRSAKHLTPALKRYWLQLAPHLHEDDRRRLAAILRGEG